MSQRLKRWESPRREGRNDKGRGGSARQRQKQKQMKALRQRLKSDEPKPLEKPPKGDRPKPQNKKGRERCSLPFLFGCVIIREYKLSHGFDPQPLRSLDLNRVSCHTSCDFPKGEKAADQAFSA